MQMLDEQQLLNQLMEDIRSTSHERVLFLAGHFPLLYTEDSEIAIEAFEQWGSFSVYTLELACKLAKFAVSLGKTVQFVFFVDDHAYEEVSGLNSTARSKRRRELYTSRSGEAVLPDLYRSILNKYGFSENHVLRQNQHKLGREDCLYFSEKILRESTRQIDNACAREYTEFLQNTQYFQMNETYLIAFVPNRCKGHICNIALQQEVTYIDASHVFMETRIPDASPADLYTAMQGVTYRKD